MPQSRWVQPLSGIRRRSSHDPAGHRRPFERAVLEPLPIQHDAAAVPDQDFYAVRTLGPENQCDPPKVDPAPALSWASAANPSAPLQKSTGLVATGALRPRRRRQHQRLRRRAEKTSRSASAPGRPRTCTVAPAISISRRNFLSNHPSGHRRGCLWQQRHKRGDGFAGGPKQASANLPVRASRRQSS